MAEKKRYTIGMFVSGITDYFTANLCRGVMRGAEELDMNVVVLPGKYLFRDFSKCPEKRFEYQYTTIFSHVQKNNIDGLIIAAGSIGSMTTEQKLMEFLAQYKDIPSVLVASSYEGYSCISYDNKNAVAEGIEYMIEKAGCRNICILDGPDGNTDEQERKAQYLEVLRKHNHTFRSAMRAEGDLMDSATTRRAAKSLILDNPRMDGLFCVNDAMAFAAYDVMNELGMRPGVDIKIMGYDNEQRSVTMDPPLATVSADAVNMGIRSAEVILQKIEGEDPGNIILPSRFILRESLGEPEKEPEYEFTGDRQNRWADFERIFTGYVKTNGREKAKEGFGRFEEFMEELLAAIEGDLLLSLSKQKILDRLEAFFETDATIHMEPEELLFYIEEQTQAALEARRHDTEDEVQLQTLLMEIYKQLILEADKRYTQLENLQDRQKSEMRDFVRESLNIQNTSDSSYLSMLKCLDWMDVKNACLYLYEKTILHKDGDTFPKQPFYYVKAYCENGVAKLAPDAYRKIPQEELFTNAALGNGRWSSVLLPLYYGEENYGVLFCDLTERMFEEGEFAAAQLGTAARMLHLLKRNEEIGRQGAHS